MELTVTTVLIAFAGVFLICFMKGAFGGGFSIVGIPLLSFVMDPVTAGGFLAPLFIAMDLFALRYWKPSTWSKPDLALLLPGLERFPFDLNRKGHRGFPRARKSDSVPPTTTAGVRDGEGILERPAGAGRLDRRGG